MSSKHTSVQTIRNAATKEEVTCKVLNVSGKGRLKTMLLPYWNEKMSDLLFGDAYVRPEDRIFEYDAFIDNKYILSFLDGDIARLIRFKETAESDESKTYEVVCYPHQLEILRFYMGENVSYKSIDLERIEENIFEYNSEYFYG